MFRTTVGLMMTLLTTVAHAGAAEDYQLVQQMRESASEQPGSTEGLQAARRTLNEALSYLDKVEVRERAEGDMYLYFRRFDVNMDLASVNAKLGDVDGTITALEAAASVAWLPPIAERIEASPAFDPLRGDPRYKAVIERLRTSDRVRTVPAMATPYKAELTLEERVAGLTLFWSEARAGFAHFDNVPELKWDEVFMRFLPRVMAARTTRDYYTVMMQLAPVLRDGHTNVYPPDELERNFYARPPMQTEWIEGKVLVTQVRSKRLRQHVRVGDELLAIDGLDVHDFVRQKVAPFVSASTPQDHRLRSYNYQLLAGDADQMLRLRLRDAVGIERNEVISRVGFDDIDVQDKFAFRMLDHGIAYLALDHFESADGLKAFEAALPHILHARALVLDLRRNGGGSTTNGSAILSYLTQQPVPSSLSFARSDTSLARVGFDFVAWAPTGGSRAYVKKRKEHFTGPVVVLAGPQTFSAAEDFLVSFVTLKRGIVFGETTGGSTGQPLVFPLPGGGTARICVKRDLWPDGSRLVGVGIKPTVEVTPTVASVRNGTDPVLEAAVTRLR